MRYTLRQIWKLSRSLSEESKQINKEQLCKIIFSIGENYLASCTRMSSTRASYIKHGRPCFTASQTAKKRAKNYQDVQCSIAEHFWRTFYCLVFHCAFLLRTMFMSWARAHERMHVHNIKRPSRGKLKLANSCWKTSRSWQNLSFTRQTRVK